VVRLAARGAKQLFHADGAAVMRLDDGDLECIAAVGSVNSTLMVEIAKAMALCSVWGMAFVWLAHALIPDPPSALGALSPKAAEPAPPDLETAHLRALRSTLIVLPIAIFFLFSSASASYVVVMIKVATMGQQANLDSTKTAGRSLLASTILGGIGAIIAWQILGVWPSLLIYTLLVGLFALLVGPRIFRGEGVCPNGPMWSYAYMTMIVVLAPAVVDQIAGDSAGAAFYSRLFLFVVVAVYGSTAVAVFDAFWPRVMGRTPPLNHRPDPV